MGRKRKTDCERFFRYEPKTENHKELVEFLRSDHEDQHLMLLGEAGTGKTVYIVQELLFKLKHDLTSKEKLIIIRSAVPTRELGFAPGRIEEKIKTYELPYIQKVNKIYGNDRGYEQIKNLGLLEFDSTSFLRGTEWEDAFIYVDEFQNLNFEECSTIITRLGNNSQIFFSGDFEQSDLVKSSEKKGAIHFSEIVRNMQHFKFLEFDINDIVRNDLVAEFLIKKKNYFNKIEALEKNGTSKYRG